MVEMACSPQPLPLVVDGSCCRGQADIEEQVPAFPQAVKVYHCAACLTACTGRWVVTVDRWAVMGGPAFVQMDRKGSQVTDLFAD